MPTYEYGCDACGHQFEQFQSIKDDPLKKCPKCGKLKLQRLISATSFQLKGGGWYSDGYGAKKKTRTENDRADRLQKALDDDKKKTAKTDSAEKKSDAA